MDGQDQTNMFPKFFEVGGHKNKRNKRKISRLRLVLNSMKRQPVYTKYDCPSLC